MAKKKLTIEDVLVPNEEIPNEVPENWCWTRLKYIAEFKNGYAFKSKDFIDTGLQVIRMGNLYGGKLDLDRQPVFIDENANNEFVDKYCITNGDILLTLTGTKYKRDYGYAVLIDINRSLLLNQRILSLKSNKISNKYLYYYLKSEIFRDLFFLNETGGVNQGNVSSKCVENIVIPLPPLVEQERIVNRIESLFEKVDKASELVEEAREGFEKRRAAILEKAFSGELTKGWREKNEIEFYSKKIKLSEVVSINPKKPKLEIEEDKICSFVPMVAVSDINGAIESLEERLYSKVKKGYTYFEEKDVLFAKITPCMENGKSCIAEGLRNEFGFGTTEFHVLRCGEKVLNKYIYYLVRAKWFREQAKQHMTGAVGQQRVPKTYLEEYPIWVPSIDEQKEIVRLLDFMLEKEIEIEGLCDIDSNVELLKKSILGRAFRGELGSNDLKEQNSIELLKGIL